MRPPSVAAAIGRGVGDLVCRSGAVIARCSPLWCCWPQQLDEVIVVALEEVSLARRSLHGRGALGTRVQPRQRALEGQVAHGQEPADSGAQDIAVQPTHLELGREHRSVIRRQGELDERQLVIPTQELSVGDPERVVQGGREMDPQEHRGGWVQDEGDPDIRPSLAVEAQIPAGDAVTISTLDGRQAKFIEPIVDALRIDERPWWRLGQVYLLST